MKKYSFFDFFFQKFLFGNFSVQSYLNSLENQREHPKHNLINTVNMIDIVSSNYAPRSNSDLQFYFFIHNIPKALIVCDEVFLVK